MSLPKKSFNEFKDECLERISPIQDEFMKLYDIPSYEEWFYDHGIGAFHFKSHDGRNLYFKYVDVGSYSTTKNTWMWSWDNKSTPKHVANGLEKVRGFGDRNNFTELTQGLIDGDEYTGWAMTAVTASLLNAVGISGIQKIEVHGIIWLLDRFLTMKLITKKEALSQLKHLMVYNKRLPMEDCERRISEWS